MPGIDEVFDEADIKAAAAALAVAACRGVGAESDSGILGAAVCVVSWRPLCPPQGSAPSTTRIRPTHITLSEARESSANACREPGPTSGAGGF